MSGIAFELPAGPARLLAHDSLPLPADATPWLIARLLEDGDRVDLAWLFSTVGRRDICAWFRLHGGRRLSRRSAAYWAAVLGEPPVDPHPLAEELWSL
ncbi:MAG TPA: hypothetical protein PK413_00505 [Thermoanaerobaculia bacterium]|nr:hypothetical protein [Thermoanaerobaculia bacterium]